MKYSKTIMLTAGVVATLVVGVWFMRNAVVQRVSNPLLQKYGMAIADVSLDALSTNDATIGYLELVHEKGTTISIEGLSLPINTTSTGPSNYAAEKVSIIIATRTEGAPFELAVLIDQLLSLPGLLGHTRISIGELAVPLYPDIHNLHLVFKDNSLDMQATVESVAMSLAVTQTDASTPTIVFSLPGESPGAYGNSINAKMQRSAESILLSAISPLELTAWEPLGRLTGALPPEISPQSGTAELGFEIEIPYNTAQGVSMTAALTPSGPLQFSYSDNAGETAIIKLESGSPVNLAASFPAVAWSLQQARAAVTVSYGEWLDIPLSITELACEPGPLCSLQTSVSMKDATLPFAAVDQLALSSTQKIAFLDEGLQFEVQPGASLSISGLSMSDTRIAGVSATLVSTATLELLDGGWRLAADSLDAELEAIALSDTSGVSMPLFLEKLSVSDSGAGPAASLVVHAPRGVATLTQRNLELPGFNGRVSYQDNSVTATLETLGLQQNGSIDARHNLDTGTGRLTVVDVGASFAAKSLSSRVSPWGENWDIAAGNLLVDLEANWTQAGSALRLEGQSSLQLQELAGHYGETAFVGMSTSLEAAYDSDKGFSMPPTGVTVDLIEMGLPIEDISANYTLYPEDMAFDMADLRMAAFGGVISADPFSFRTAADVNTVLMHAEGIELNSLLALEEFEAIEVSGTVGAELPVAISESSLTITNGRLVGEPPGGVVRYHAATEADETDTSSIAFVTHALSNFRYETLTSEIDYDTAGDLKLQLRLTGRNPDLETTRPVVLNLGVENNVPQMLKSLRAARTVEGILEQRLQEQDLQ
jgi:hypothetical protein